jgi:ribosomal protein L7/L12
MIAKEESEIKGKIWLDDYLHLLNRIASSRCLIEKIKVLYETIIERKAELFSELTLQKFVSKHAGAEHKAGVKHGGTLILLYYSKNTAPSNQYQIIQQQLHLLKGGVNENDLKMHSGFSAAREKETEAIYGRHQFFQPDVYVENIPGSLNVNVGERFRKPLSDEPNQGDVIGDLCLPYVCCSDTPSVTFVFPDQLATLRIPVDHVCVDANGNADPVALNVMPAGGTVKAFIGQTELDKVIAEKENGLFFNPSKVSRELYGETIRFEVNGQAVEPTLHIVQKPKASFKISDDVVFERNNTGAVLVIKNNSVPFDELQFEWNINGHRVANENATEFKHPLKVSLGQNLSVNVKLTAFNEYCSDTHTDTIEIDVPGGQRPNEPDRPDPNEPDGKVDLFLKTVGDRKIQVIKVVREITGSSLKISKDIVERAPTLLQKGISVQKAKEYAKMFKEVGATVDIKK